MDKRVLVTAVLVSLFTGAVSGAGSFMILNNIQHEGRSFVADSELEVDYVEESPLIESIDKASPSVVSIIAKKELERYVGGSPFGMFGFPFNDFRGGQFQEPEIVTEEREIGGGTGFIVSADGLAITNKHVVDDEEADYSVFLTDGTQLYADVLGKDPFNDIAVVQLYTDEELSDKASGLPVADLGDSDSLKVGARVIAIGNALSEFDNTTTAGIVSGKGRQIVAGSSSPFGGGTASRLSGLIQTDASINPGNSGGPLVNIFGEVVGMNTAVADANGIGFAIPINDVKSVLESVKEYGEIRRPYLGVRYMEINPEIAAEFDLPAEYGAYLQDDIQNRTVAVIPDGPADKAGLESGDLIISLGGKELSEEVNLQMLVRDLMVGESVEVEFYRDGELRNVEITLESMETE